MVRWVAGNRYAQALDLSPGFGDLKNHRSEKSSMPDERRGEKEGGQVEKTVK